ncbi:hypothetical protein KsCSTR_06820 [Candidatus Kuenenia stuttgartiensis]|uniref:Uncharacterized protein n=1 Tax=Kuenenia stuttgartiensis TaxID=174633 RepID=A0A6G7GKW4_KUEST|nr:hypothetical protein KsCSTR_06820 [Candidatus Kuenenia stuttgartiensis]
MRNPGASGHRPRAIINPVFRSATPPCDIHPLNHPLPIEFKIDLPPLLFRFVAECVRSCFEIRNCS